MIFSGYFSVAVATVSHVLAVPTSSQSRQVVSDQNDTVQFFLRANWYVLSRFQRAQTLILNSPQEPWHNRHIVQLPGSGQLGLENFTIHPPTPPVKFRPISLENGYYALEGEEDDDERSPLLTALMSTKGTRTASMAMIYLPPPSEFQTRDEFVTCPEGYECSTGEWTFGNAGTDGVHEDFRFGKFKGQWQPFKDAGREGWHVYWKGNAGLDHPIKLDLVPLEE